MHEFIGDVFCIVVGIVGDRGLLDRLERIDDVLLGRRAHAIGNRLAGILALVELCQPQSGPSGSVSRYLGRGEDDVLHDQSAPRAFLLGPDVEKEHVATERRFAVCR